MLTRGDVATLYRFLLAREASDGEVDRILRQHQEPFRLLHACLSSAEYVGKGLAAAPDLHLYLIHAARVKLVSAILPPARRIADLGGVNSPLHHMGYPHPFEEIICVDLPPEDRCDMYRHLKVEQARTERGLVSVLYTNFVDLSPIPDGSIDMVWAGQSIEHITEHESLRVYGEVRRVLRPDGSFCLDTPNRNLTELQTTGWIHPEHKIEYRPSHLKENLTAAGFTIQQELGVCEMVRSRQTGAFDYADFFVGSGISADVEGSYIQYYRCVKR